MKIDLHCHTKSVKQGDPPTRNVSPEDFARAVVAAGVDIVAITNHNTFDKQQFVELRGQLDESVLLWPGIELDVHGAREGSHWHMLVIVGPDDLGEFDEVVQALVSDVPVDGVDIDIADIFQSFKELNAVYISHAHDKDPHITEADIEDMKRRDVGSWRLFFEPRKLATVGIWSNHGFNMMLGSDVTDWGNYPGCELPSLRLPVDSFEQFCLLAKRDGNTIETLLNGTETFDVMGHPHEGVDVPLTLRNEINVFFGQKGTGKTELLHSIEKQLTERGKTCLSYSGNTKHEGFQALLSTDDAVRDPASFGRADGSRELSILFDWKEGAITPLGAYVSWWKTKGNNRNKERFRLSEAQSLHEVGDGKCAADKAAAESLERFNREMGPGVYGRYLDEKDAETFGSLLESLSEGIEREHLKDFIEYRSVELANKALESIKAQIDAKSDTKSKPSSTGFVEFAQNRMQLCLAASKLLSALEPGETTERSYLGELDDKGRAYIATRCRYLCPDSRTEEFGLGINKLKDCKRKLQSVQEGAFGESAGRLCSELKDACADAGVADLAPFIGVKRYVVLDGRPGEYSPSSGEEGILLLGHKLSDRTADVYILDEPELGMSNSYIDAVVRRRIQELAAANKTVLIATHNANLAVRTLPYVSVYREHVNGDVYRTYVGNPFSDSLVDIDDPSNTLSWATKSLEVLEGSEEAFYNRRDIYEAGM